MFYRNILNLTLIFINYKFILCSIISGDGNGRGVTNGNGIELIPGVVTTDNYHGTCSVYSDCPSLSCVFYERCCYDGYCICGTSGREDKCKGKIESLKPQLDIKEDINNNFKAYFEYIENCYKNISDKTKFDGIINKAKKINLDNIINELKKIEEIKNEITKICGSIKI